jgi:hypothetical protein
MAAGGVIFGSSSGGAAQDASNFVWDNTNKRLGIGTAVPYNLLDVVIPVTTPAYVYIQDTAITLHVSGTGTLHTSGWHVVALNLAQARDGVLGPAASQQLALYDHPSQIGCAGYVFPVARKVKTIRFWTTTDLSAAYCKISVQRDVAGAWVETPIVSWGSQTAAYNTTQAIMTELSGMFEVDVAGDLTSTSWRISVQPTGAGSSNYFRLSELLMTALVEDANPVLLQGTSLGRLGFGTVTPDAKGDINNTEDYLSLRVLRSGATTTDNIVSFYSDYGGAASLKQEFRVGGDINIPVSANYAKTSDQKLKTQLTAATPKLNDLNAVEVGNFYALANPDVKLLGFIANQVQTVFPGLVTSVPDKILIPDPDWIPGAGQNEDHRPMKEVLTGENTLSVKESVFIPILVKALQELSAKHDDLNARLTLIEQGA